jgi:hypothetical protein
MFGGMERSCLGGGNDGRWPMADGSGDVGVPRFEVLHTLIMYHRGTPENEISET